MQKAINKKASKMFLFAFLSILLNKSNRVIRLNTAAK